MLVLRGFSRSAPRSTALTIGNFDGVHLGHRALLARLRVVAAEEQLLPTALAGQLIVFETLSALAMGFAWRGEWPPAGSWLGIALLVAGVVLGVRAFSPRGAAD